MPKNLSEVTIRIQDQHVQTRTYLTREEYEKEKQKEKDNPKYKTRYDMYNSFVEDCPLLSELPDFQVGSIFNYRIPYAGGSDCKIEILKINEKI